MSVARLAIPPTLIIHGDADRNVPFQQGQRMFDRLTAAGVPAKLIPRKGQGHAYSGWNKDSALIADWFDEFLKDRK